MNLINTSCPSLPVIQSSHLLGPLHQKCWWLQYRQPWYGSNRSGSCLLSETAPPFQRSYLQTRFMVLLSINISFTWHVPGFLFSTETDWENLDAGICGDHSLTVIVKTTNSETLFQIVLLAHNYCRGAVFAWVVPHVWFSHRWLKFMLNL